MVFDIMAFNERLKIVIKFRETHQSSRIRRTKYSTKKKNTECKLLLVICLARRKNPSEYNLIHTHIHTHAIDLHSADFCCCALLLSSRWLPTVHGSNTCRTMNNKQPQNHIQRHIHIQNKQHTNIQPNIIISENNLRTQMSLFGILPFYFELWLSHARKIQFFLSSTTMNIHKIVVVVVKFYLVFSLSLSFSTFNRWKVSIFSL